MQKYTKLFLDFYQTLDMHNKIKMIGMYIVKNRFHQPHSHA